MNKYEIMILIQTVCGFVGMAVWYQIGKARGKKSHVA